MVRALGGSALGEGIWPIDIDIVEKPYNITTHTNNFGYGLG